MAYYNGKPYYEVYVGHIATSVTEDMLRTVFAECGHIVRCFLSPSDPFHTFTFGFVRFEDDASCLKALELNGKEISDMSIVVELSSKHPNNANKQKLTELEHKMQPAAKTRHDIDLRDRQTYIEKCFDDASSSSSGSHLPQWMIYLSMIQRQPASSSPPFTYPMKPLQLDLYKLGDLVQQMRHETSRHQPSTKLI